MTCHPFAEVHEVFLPKEAVNESILNTSGNVLINVWRTRYPAHNRVFSLQTWNHPAMGLHPILVPGLAADFDGDTWEFEIIDSNGYELTETSFATHAFPQWQKKDLI